MNTELLRLSLFRLTLLLAVLTISWLATTGEDVPLVASVWDKANHFVAFLVLAALVDFSFPRRPFDGIKLLALLGYGLLIEGVQYFLPARYFSLHDLLADGLGVSVYILLLPLIRRSYWQRWRYAWHSE